MVFAQLMISNMPAVLDLLMSPDPRESLPWSFSSPSGAPDSTSSTETTKEKSGKG